MLRHFLQGIIAGALYSAGWVVGKWSERRAAREVEHVIETDLP